MCRLHIVALFLCYFCFLCRCCVSLTPSDEATNSFGALQLTLVASHSTTIQHPSAYGPTRRGAEWKKLGPLGTSIPTKAASTLYGGKQMADKVHLSGDLVMPSLVLALGVLLAILISKLQQLGGQSNFEAEDHQELEALVMAVSGEDDHEGFTVSPKNRAVPSLKCNWPRVLTFCATPLVLGPIAILVHLFFHVPVLGSAFHFDLEVCRRALLWSIPWISISVLPVERIPGLGILEEINQVGKFINMICLGLEKNFHSLPKVMLATVTLFKFIQDGLSLTLFVSLTS
eukprot:GGOE01053886.1.p1 GENE.GGOE01053886.1~~GGOE01053886.1.p1  ORF type:complete len:287 (-),score=18.83 GGOE01053886.1:598-1458(-)